MKAAPAIPENFPRVPSAPSADLPTPDSPDMMPDRIFGARRSTFVLTSTFVRRGSARSAALSAWTSAMPLMVTSMMIAIRSPALSSRWIADATARMSFTDAPVSPTLTATFFVSSTCWSRWSADVNPRMSCTEAPVIATLMVTILSPSIRDKVRLIDTTAFATRCSTRRISPSNDVPIFSNDRRAVPASFSKDRPARIACLDADLSTSLNWVSKDWAIAAACFDADFSRSAKCFWQRTVATRTDCSRRVRSSSSMFDRSSSASTRAFAHGCVTLLPLTSRPGPRPAAHV